MNHAAKIDLLGAVALSPAVWDETAEKWSRMIPHDWPGDQAAILKDAIVHGDARAVDMVTPEGRAGVIVYTIDDSYPRAELLILAAAGRADGVNLTAEFLPQMAGLARSLGCATFRFHTMRPGLVRKALRAGLHVSEIVMRSDVL